MIRFVLFMIMAVCASVSAQATEKRIAVLDIVDNAGTVSDPVKECIHKAVSDKIAQFRGYELCNITELGNLGITRSTRIDELQAAELHKAHNIDLAIVISLSYRTSANVILYATLIELPSGSMQNTAAITSETAMFPLISASQDLVDKLLLLHKFTETAAGVNIQMVLVGAGVFQMGLDEAPTVGEQPAHTVALDDYYIGATEVTQGQWRAVMGDNPSHFRGDNLPVDGVTWEEAQLFCKKLSELSGRHYTLPTEAQWEYAARGGNRNSGAKCSGRSAVDAVAWYKNNSGNSTHPVKQKTPNELGLYDMSGNVWEWCGDWYGSYTSSSQSNPTGPTSGSSRVMRGGGWLSDARRCRVSYRSNYTPSNRNYSIGFRVVCLSAPTAQQQPAQPITSSHSNNDSFFAGLNVIAYKEEFECNGIYSLYNKDGKAKFLSITPTNFNRHDFGYSLEFFPKEGDSSRILLSLSSGWRVFNIEFKNGVIYIDTDNGRHSYNTGIVYNMYSWNKLVLRHKNGVVYINDKIITDVIINKVDRDNEITSLNYACGDAFHGIIRNLKVYN